MGGVELLKDLVHDGVGEIGNHWQLYFSAEDWVRGKKGDADGKRLGKSERKSIFFLSNSDLLLQLHRLTYSKALWMSCAALSIRAVRMAERGMDTRSETDERGGVSLSAAEEDRGQSSRQRDTMESTITCNWGRLLVTLWSVTDESIKKNKGGCLMYLQLLVGSFGEFTGQRVQSLPHRPIHRQHVSQLTQWRVELEAPQRRDSFIFSVTEMQILHLHVAHHSQRENSSPLLALVLQLESPPSLRRPATNTPAAGHAHRGAPSPWKQTGGGVLQVQTLTNRRRARRRCWWAATCSAVLVTRPWCSRKACLCEKRWVWLFLTRARWICAAKHQNTVTVIIGPRKHEEHKQTAKRRRCERQTAARGAKCKEQSAVTLQQRWL